MFTGIITEKGTVSAVLPTGGGLRLTVEAPSSAAELNVNDSVSINGVCQTVIAKGGTQFTVEAVEETLKKTTLGALRVSSPVNLELPVRLNDRLGGHLVQGHVDGVGVIRAVAKQHNSWLLTVEFAPQFARYVVPVGSIAIDGVSLTVARKEGNTLVVSIIPHTLEMTTLVLAAEGTRVNLEFDLVGKYVESMLRTDTGSGKDGDQLRDRLKGWGYEL
jgi:riboflavin synthase